MKKSFSRFTIARYKDVFLEDFRNNADHWFYVIDLYHSSIAFPSYEQAARAYNGIVPESEAIPLF